MRPVMSALAVALRSLERLASIDAVAPVVLVELLVAPIVLVLGSLVGEGVVFV
jgi:hypothetical protein